MAPPLPNSAHGDQLISAKPRGTARFRATFMCDPVETVHIRIGICPDSQPGGQHSNLRILNRAALLTNLSGARSTPTSR
jgi:hypothetical protein